MHGLAGEASRLDQNLAWLQVADRGVDPGVGAARLPVMFDNPLPDRIGSFGHADTERAVAVDAGSGDAIDLGSRRQERPQQRIDGLPPAGGGARRVDGRQRHRRRPAAPARQLRPASPRRGLAARRPRSTPSPHGSLIFSATATTPTAAARKMPAPDLDGAKALLPAALWAAAWPAVAGRLRGLVDQRVEFFVEI